MLDAIVHQLSVAWDELGGPELARGEVDTEGDAGVLTPIGEPTLSVTLRAQDRRPALDDVAADPVGRDRAVHGEHPRRRRRAAAPTRAGADALRRGLAGAQVLLRAEVGSVQMPIERMLELAPGALVALAEAAPRTACCCSPRASRSVAGTPDAAAPRRAVKLDVHRRAADPRRHLREARTQRARTGARAPRQHAAQTAEGREILRSIFVRVWAELGRTHLPLGRALELAQGAVVELDQAAEEPVELFANGLCFANGSLVVTPDGAWGVQVAKLLQ